MSAATLQPETILGELRELWENLGHEEGPPGGVLRACAMTLLVTAWDDADAMSVGETLAELMHEHPSRAIVIRATSREPDRLDARVFAQCWMPFGSRQQICCEQIEITAGSARLAEAPAVILGLSAPDLPVVLWCHGAQWFHPAGMADLFPVARKLIFDSRGAPGTAAALDFLAGLRHNRLKVADLAWARLTCLREIIAHVFEDGGNRRQLDDVRSVLVEYGGDPRPPGPCYLAAWLQRALPGARVELRQAEGPSVRDVRAVRFEGPAVDISLSAVEEAGLEVRLGAHSRRCLCPPSSDWQLLREELTVTGFDPVYDDVLPPACRLAAERA